MSAFELDSVRLLHVKNPWGDVEIKSAYSDKSNVWTPQFKSKVESMIGYTISLNEDDGLFFIEYNEFIEHFDEITVGLYMENA